MPDPNPGSPLDNALLSALPRGQFNILLRPYLTIVSVVQATLLLETGDECEHVYFPHNGMLSLLVVLQDGQSIETATVVREGVVGGMS